MRSTGQILPLICLNSGKFSNTFRAYLHTFAAPDSPADRGARRQMNPTLVLTFWGVAFLLIVVPGPDWAFVLASGLRDRTVAPAVGGLMLGYALLTVIVAAGVGAVVTQRPVVLTVLTVVGAGYLVYLGASLLTTPSAIHSGTQPCASSPPWKVRLARGVGVSALNPKGLLIFLAVLPQFTQRAGGWPLALQITALGLVFIVTCGVFYAVLGASTRAILLTRPTVARIVSRISGVAMIVIGVVLVLERLVELRSPTY